MIKIHNCKTLSNVREIIIVLTVSHQQLFLWNYKGFCNYLHHKGCGRECQLTAVHRWKFTCFSNATLGGGGWFSKRYWKVSHPAVSQTLGTDVMLVHQSWKTCGLRLHSLWPCWILVDLSFPLTFRCLWVRSTTGIFPPGWHRQVWVYQLHSKRWKTEWYKNLETWHSFSHGTEVSSLTSQSLLRKTRVVIRWSIKCVSPVWVPEPVCFFPFWGRHVYVTPRCLKMSGRKGKRENDTSTKSFCQLFGCVFLVTARVSGHQSVHWHPWKKRDQKSQDVVWSCGSDCNHGFILL